MVTPHNLFATIAIVASLGLGTKVFADDAVLIQAPIDKVFVPQGFDDNDKVELILHGEFSSTCYRIGPVDSNIDLANKEITITASAYYYQETECAQVMTPFIKSVELKETLPAGTYTIKVVNRPNAETSKLVITRSARPDPDDYLYAGVQSAGVEDRGNGARNLVLKGQHPFLYQGCVKLDQVKTNLSPSKVIVVQPITKIENDEDQCTGDSEHGFEYHVPLNTPLTRGQYVIHVRTLDGNSVNQLIRIE